MSEPSFTLRKRGWRCWKFRCFLHEFSYVAPRYSSRFHHNKFLECDTLFQTTFEKLLSICSAVVDCSLRCNEAAAVFSPLLFFAVFCYFFTHITVALRVLLSVNYERSKFNWNVFPKSPLPCLSPTHVLSSSDVQPVRSFSEVLPKLLCKSGPAALSKRVVQRTRSHSYGLGWFGRCVDGEDGLLAASFVDHGELVAGDVATVAWTERQSGWQWRHRNDRNAMTAPRHVDPLRHAVDHVYLKTIAKPDTSTTGQRSEWVGRA